MKEVKYNGEKYSPTCSCWLEPKIQGLNDIHQFKVQPKVYAQSPYPEYSQVPFKHKFPQPNLF